MNANDYWSMFMKTGAPEIYLMYKNAKDLEEALLHADPSTVFITHSGCDDALLDEVRTYIESLNRFQNIYVNRAGGVISSHCGPGTLGILFYAD